MGNQELLFSLLRSEILGEAAEAGVIASLDFETAVALLQMAKKQDFAHTLASALLRSDFFERGAAADASAENLQALKKSCERACMLGVYRHEKLMRAQNEILRVLAEEKIAHVPLKGAVLREYYPQPWQRSSCDIDILVHEEDLSRACEALSRDAGYRVVTKKGFHDIHLYSPEDVHLELHFNILSTHKEYDAVLSRVWDYTEQNANNSYLFDMKSAFFVLHHAAHMAYHFSGGGCGIKPFLDLFIMQTRMQADFEGARGLLCEAGLSAFFENALALCRAWFMGGAHTELTRRAEEFLFMGGVYGTVDNRVLLQQKNSGGRFGYALSRIFAPMELLCRAYPVLHRHPWLMPLMQVRRWVRIAFGGGLRRGARELSANHRITETEAMAAAAFLSEMGL